MEASAQSSKVTVEYHDPSGVFPLIADEIATRLPLRNLNWQPPSRPLRQIKSLHLEFVADNVTQNSLRPLSARTDAHDPNSFEILRNGGKSSQNAVKERRHQIPGLKKSAYLKIYVLRCDDSEVYKDLERKRIRDWVRETSGVDSRRDNHDAFEWMILHVVIPDTVAASEPRWRDYNSKESDELKERPKSNSKWPGKSTKTVFDRLRADFNESGKSRQDRVAQIRLVKANMPPDLLPTPAVAPTLEESTQERENAWSDLISKFKIFILGPFDLRVRQYEADIADQEMRRALPGWNFCTFFIHKEGLAKALESIGLVEDALAIYDELSIGLDAVIRDIATGAAAGTATRFALFTDDIADRIASCSQTQGRAAFTGNEELQLDDVSALFTRDYRKLIVTSNISVFDFLCYIFSRQKSLILRLANARATRMQPTDRGMNGGENLVLFSEVCWRTSSFIHVSSRVLRQDLRDRTASDQINSSRYDIDGLVCSWAYAVAGQALRDTVASVLQDLLDPGQVRHVNAGQGPRRRVTMTLGVGADAYPQRSASLPGRRSVISELQRPLSRSSSGTTATFRPQSSPGSDLVRSSGLPGQAELATYRADLIAMRRKVLENLAARQGWSAGWASFKHVQTKGTHDLTQSNDLHSIQSSTKIEGQHQSLPLSLRNSLESASAFRTAFEQSTELAIRHYSIATQNKSMESLIGDMAISKAQSADYKTALSYFDRIVSQITVRNWNAVEFEALKLFMICLKETDRRSDYINTLLDLLSRACSMRLERTPQFVTDYRDVFGDTLDVTAMLSDLVTFSNTLSQEITVDAERYFANIEIAKEVEFRENQDGFSLRLSLQHLLADEAQVEVTCRLVSVDDPLLEIFLQAATHSKLRTGPNAIDLHSSTVACGAFQVDHIVMKAGKIRFLHEFASNTKDLSLTTTGRRSEDEDSKFQPPPIVYIYPAVNAFNARISSCSRTKIGKSRTMEIALESGHNNVQSIHLKIKPKSAGLRLHLAEATCSGKAVGSRMAFQQGQLSFGSLEAGSEATVSIPYTLEQNTKEISLRLEIEYSTPSGPHQFLSSTSMVNALPLDVDVHDQFHLDTLFSRFTVRAVDLTPLSILDAHLAESVAYAVQGPPFLPLPITVYRSQPMQLAYKVQRKVESPGSGRSQSTALVLTLRYQTVDEIVHGHLHRTFDHDLRSSDFLSVSRLLVPIFMERCRNLIPDADMEMAAMTGIIDVPGFEAFGWADILKSLREPLQGALSTWLLTWHGQHRQIDIQEEFAQETAPRTITIDVEVPHVDLAFDCSLNLINPGEWVHRGTPIMTLGQPIPAMMRIKYTTRWAGKRADGGPSDGLKFVCEVSDDPETWLVGGHRRSHFTVTEDHEHTVNLTLIALRLGYIRLPSINISLAPSGSDEQESQRSRPSVLFETHHRSAARAVQVIRNTRTTRVDVVESSVEPSSSTPSANNDLTYEDK